MARSDWLAVGFKLLGIFFGVSGLAIVWQTLTSGFFASRDGAPAWPGVMALFLPAVQLVAGYFLVWQTGVCLRLCGESAFLPVGRLPSADPVPAQGKT